MRCRLLAIGVLVFPLATAASAQWVWTPETGRFVNMDRLPKETPELQVEFERSLLVGGEYKRAFNETDKFDTFYGDTEFADQNQYIRGEIRLAQQNYAGAATEFQKVVSQYPGSDLYDDVIRRQYDIGDTLYDKGLKRTKGKTGGFMAYRPMKWIRAIRLRPFKNAVDVYTMVIENQPFTPEAAEAQYKIGKCHFAREQYLEAGFEFRRVIEDYPGSDWVREASYDLSRAYEESALGPDYDQAPSRLAMESIADFARRFPDDSRVGERRDVSEQMRESIAEQRYRSARFYERRRDLDAARIYYEITAYEFIGTDASDKAVKWLEKNPAQPDLQSSFLGPAVPKP
jgi:outer membrane protein assembly factor BamD (BamD/ComL family)